MLILSHDFHDCLTEDIHVRLPPVYLADHSENYIQKHKFLPTSLLRHPTSPYMCWYSGLGQTFDFPG